MLKSKSVANLIEETLNKNDRDEQFRVVYEVGGYKGRAINCILKQGKGSVMPISNYTNTKTPFRLEVVTPVQCGEDRIDDIVDIVNNCLLELNGKIEDIDNGKAVFLFNSLEIGEYETRATAGQSVLIKIEFFVEYAMNVGTKYELALITNEFDYGSVNTRRFDTRQQQIDWFDKRIKNGADYCEVLMPNIDSLVLTQQRYLNTHNLDVNDVLQMNYAIIRETKENGETKYYYYYVTNSNISEYNLITLDLSMDTLQTHYIDLEFGDCFISKADINRWIDNGDGTVSFDTSVNSELFERESIKDVSKRLVKRDVVTKFNNVVGGYKINEWLNKNVFGWYYLFISSNSNIKTGSFSKGGVDDEYYDGDIQLKPIIYKHKSMEEDILLVGVDDYSLYNTLVCVALPVMKTNKKMYFAQVSEIFDDNGIVTGHNVSNALELSRDSLNAFVKNLGSSYIYAMKFSQVPPLRYIKGFLADVNWQEDDNGNLVIQGKSVETSFTTDKEHKYNVLVPSGMDYGWEVEAINIDGGDGKYGILNVLAQVNINIDMSYQMNDIEYTFKKTDIVGKAHNIKFNPKLLSSDYCGLVLSDYLQNGSEYDILKLGNKNLTITYTEALTPDITKKYIRLSDLDGYYIPEIADNLTGYVVSDDTSFTLETEQYKSMLANNKNFFLQNSINRGMEYGKATLLGGVNALTSMGLGFIGGGGVTGAMNTAVGYANSVANAYLNREQSQINENLTVDNLKNAPNSITGAKGNVIFNAMYSDLGVVVEMHDILPNEKKMVDDNINMYGMTLNKVENIKKYDNIRAYHNYIQANIENIKGNISSPIRDDIRQRFANGIRFWNVDEISYENENYERWLEA